MQPSYGMPNALWTPGRTTGASGVINAVGPRLLTGRIFVRVPTAAGRRAAPGAMSARRRRDWDIFSDWPETAP